MINARLAIKDVHCLLNERNALIVHFSGMPPGIGQRQNILFPNDLQYAMVNPNQQRCCSAIVPGNTNLNGACYGEVGLILDIKTSESLVVVRRNDAGTAPSVTPEAVTIGDCEFTLVDDTEAKKSCWKKWRDREKREWGGADPNTAWNEWKIRDFTVKGIYVENPNTISVWGNAPAGGGEKALGQVPATLRYIRTSLRDLPIYSYAAGSTPAVTCPSNFYD